MRRRQLRPRAPPRLLRAAAATTAQPCALPRPVSSVWRLRRQISRAPYPALSPSCSSGDDSSAARPAWPRLLRVATTTTARPRALPRPVSFVWRRRRQLSRAPCPSPSPSCGEDDDSSAARPALPHLLRVARTTTAQPCALPRLLRVARTTTAQPHAPPRPISFVWRRRRQLSPPPCPVSFVWRGRRQLSHTPCPAPSPSCSGGDDSSAA